MATAVIITIIICATIFATMCCCGKRVVNNYTQSV